MDKPFSTIIDPKKHPFDELHPVSEGCYKPHVGRQEHTLLFCFQCQISFYEGPAEGTNNNLAYRGAEQIALGHAKALKHTICSASPERHQ